MYTCKIYRRILYLKSYLYYKKFGLRWSCWFGTSIFKIEQRKKKKKRKKKSSYSSHFNKIVGSYSFIKKFIHKFWRFISWICFFSLPNNPSSSKGLQVKCTADLYILKPTQYEVYIPVHHFKHLLKFILKIISELYFTKSCNFFLGLHF